MKLKSLLFSALMLLTTDMAWADVTINESNFPDVNFRSWLLSQSYGSDGVLTDDEIAGVTRIDVYYGEIQNLKGIEYFTALTELWCFGNQLTSLDVSGCTALTWLWCSENQLTSLDVSGCTALEQLWCQNNPLASLDVSKNTALSTLNCQFNQLTSLDVSKNTELKSLWCRSNQLTSLDVTKNTQLWGLYCGENKLTALDVSKNTALTYLYCYSNQIKGRAMDALVASLPTVSYSTGTMCVIYYENEQNEMTTTQVAAAKAKGWIPYYTDGEEDDEHNDYIWKEYAGVDPSTGINSVEASEADDSAPWYTIGGAKLLGKPTAAGIYIHGGKKVVVK